MQTAHIGDLEVFDVRDRFPYVPGRSYDTRALGSITHFVQHHTAGGLRVPFTVEASLAVLQNIHNWHTGNNGWPAIGYHFGIDGEGRVYWTNGLDLISYHARAANAYGIGVCWLGDFETTAPNPKMVEAAVRLWKALGKHLKRAITLIGHREAPTNATSCPGHHWAHTKQVMLGLQPVAPPVTPATIQGFEAVGPGVWKCTLTGADLSWRMLDFYRESNGLFWLGYPRTNGWRTIDGKIAKVFQRGIVEIKPEHVKDNQVDPNVSASQLFQLSLLGDQWLRARGEL